MRMQRQKALSAWRQGLPLLTRNAFWEWQQATNYAKVMRKAVAKGLQAYHKGLLANALASWTCHVEDQRSAPAALRTIYVPARLSIVPHADCWKRFRHIYSGLHQLRCCITLQPMTGKSP